MKYEFALINAWGKLPFLYDYNIYKYIGLPHRAKSIIIIMQLDYVCKSTFPDDIIKSIIFSQYVGPMYTKGKHGEVTYCKSVADGTVPTHSAAISLIANFIEFCCTFVFLQQHMVHTFNIIKHGAVYYGWYCYRRACVEKKHQAHFQ